MKKQQQIEKRPNYYYGQLLLAEDFLAEQSYHISGRRQHNLKIHGSGVVKGLNVSRAHETSIRIEPGIAIDESGQEITLNSAEEFELTQEFGANDSVYVCLAYVEDSKDDSTSNTNSIGVFAVLSVSKTKDDNAGVLLAIVKLDSQGKIGAESIDYSKTKYAGKLLVPGSVGANELAPELKTGWIRLPFHPIGLVNIPEGDTELPPSFRVGPTEAVSPKAEHTEGKKDNGAAGTMPITLPPSVKKIIRFRIAGSRNEDKITVRLLTGGWDPKKMDHVNKVLLEETISGVPFLKTYEVKETDIDPEYSTLSLWVKCTKRAAISLIAVEVGY